MLIVGLGDKLSVSPIEGPPGPCKYVAV